ncbi:MAG: hypothetical protein K6G45_01685 [Lachnospiraceae bacterium]|nr:hypothetical protein [Lachnospiraceae bacterium]
MYEKLPNLVIGFHGCSKDTYDAVITHHEDLKASNNSYDWLGNGIYFWENNLARAWDWARRKYNNEAAVLGAVIDLGYCLNLTDSNSGDILKHGYEILAALCDDSGIELPKNRDSKKTKDILLRDLDCAVIQTVQKTYSLEDGTVGFDSVRGVFTEGEAAFPGSAIQAKTHIQICICNPNCIKGYFEPRSKNMSYRLP